MANQIRLKRASGSNPSASDLVTGEVAVRTDNGKLFTKKDDGSVAEISGGGIDDGDKGDITVSNSGATFTIDNGVIDNDNIATNAAISASKISGVMPTSGGAFTGNVSISDNAIEFDSDSGNTNKVSLQGPSSLSTNVTLTLPNTDGTNLQALKTDGSGNLFFGNVVKDNLEIISLYDQTSPTPIQKFLASSEGVTVLSTVANVGKLMFRDRTTANFLKFKPVDTLSDDVEFTLPSADGSNGTALTTNGSGVLSFSGPFMPLAGGTFSDSVTFAGTNYNIIFDKSNSLFRLNDDAKIAVGTGTGNDMEIFHESSSNVNEIRAIDGEIHIQADNFMLISDDTAGRAIYLDNANSRLELGFDGNDDAFFTGSGVTFNTNVDATAGLDVTGTCTATTFSGSGASLTSLNASNISSGTLAAARVATLNQDTTGNAATATALETARTIAGVSFDGTGNISLNNNAITNGAGYITGSGNAATATALQTARNIGGVSFDGTANINLPGVNTSGNQNTSGNAATATALATARTIAGVSFDGTANISLNNSNITNGAGYITATLTNEQVQDIVGNMVSGNSESGISVTYQDSDGTLDFSVTSQTDNNFTTTLKNKLDGIAAGATNVTNNNQISNGAGYLTSSSTLNSSNLSGALPAIDGSNLTGISAGGATGGGSDEVFYENGQTVTTSYTITNGKNAMAAGPITVNSGVTVTVGSGETLTIV